MRRQSKRERPERGEKRRRDIERQCMYAPCTPCTDNNKGIMPSRTLINVATSQTNKNIVRCCRDCQKSCSVQWELTSILYRAVKTFWRFACKDEPAPLILIFFFGTMVLTKTSCPSLCRQRHAIGSATSLQRKRTHHMQRHGHRQCFHSCARDGTHWQPWSANLVLWCFVLKMLCLWHWQQSHACKRLLERHVLGLDRGPLQKDPHLSTLLFSSGWGRQQIGSGQESEKQTWRTKTKTEAKWPRRTCVQAHTQSTE